MATLTILDSSDSELEGKQVEIAVDALNIGRADDNQLVLTDPRVSRYHARIAKEPQGGFLLLHKGGQSGTSVNGAPVNRHFLRHGDMIQVGATRIAFSDPPVATALPEPTAPPEPAAPTAKIEERRRGVPLWPFILVGTLGLLGAGGFFGYRYWYAPRQQHSSIPVKAAPDSAAVVETPATPDAAGRDSALPAVTHAVSRPVDLEVGDTVKVNGATVTLPAGAGKGQTRVSVGRRPGKPTRTSEGTVTVTDVFDVELDSVDVSSLSQPLLIALPLRSQVTERAMKRARIVIRTRKDDTQPWRVERTMPRRTGRSIVFPVRHLSDLQGTIRPWDPADLEGMDVSGGTTDVGLTADHPNFTHRYLTPGKKFEIAYYLNDTKQGIKKLQWQLLAGPAAHHAPAYVKDLGFYLEQALDFLTQIPARKGKLFPVGDLELPLEVWIEDTGGDSGSSPIGGPASFTARPPENSVAFLAPTAAHELVHVLQDRYYVAPPVGKTLSELMNPALVAAVNRWFVEATANLYARRAAGKLADDNYWFGASKTYLDASIYANSDTSFYAVAHLLDWLERKESRQVTAAAIVAGDNDLSDWDALVRTLGGKRLADRFEEYCRGMYAGTLAPTGFDGPSDTVVFRGRRRLYQELTVKRPAMSCSEVNVTVNNQNGDKGLLVIESQSYTGLRRFTFDPNKRDAEAFLEREPRGILLRKPGKPAVALRTVGDGASGATLTQVKQVVVNVHQKQEKQEALRYWLLLPPNQIRKRGDLVSWHHDSKAFPAGTIGYNVYLDGKRQNREVLRTKSLEIRDLYDTSGITVTVVDRHGFEWPETRAKSKPRPKPKSSPSLPPPTAGPPSRKKRRVRISINSWLTYDGTIRDQKRHFHWPQSSYRSWSGGRCQEMRVSGGDSFSGHCSRGNTQCSVRGTIVGKVLKTLDWRCTIRMTMRKRPYWVHRYRAVLRDLPWAPINNAFIVFPAARNKRRYVKRLESTFTFHREDGSTKTVRLKSFSSNLNVAGSRWRKFSLNVKFYNWKPAP